MTLQELPLQSLHRQLAGLWGGGGEGVRGYYVVPGVVRYGAVLRRLFETASKKQKSTIQESRGSTTDSRAGSHTIPNIDFQTVQGQRSDRDLVKIHKQRRNGHPGDCLLLTAYY